MGVSQAGAVTPGVVQFDQQMQQTVTMYKGNTKWNPKYYEFKLVSISNEYGKKTLATTAINLAQLASLDPDVRNTPSRPYTAEREQPQDRALFESRYDSLRFLIHGLDVADATMVSAVAGEEGVVAAGGGEACGEAECDSRVQVQEHRGEEEGHAVGGGIGHRL
jgi:hypothetical protein